MIEMAQLLLFFGSIISLLLIALTTIIWYWAVKVDKRFFYVERDLHRDRIDIEKMKQNCRNRRESDTVRGEK